MYIWMRWRDNLGNLTFILFFWLLTLVWRLVSFSPRYGGHDLFATVQSWHLYADLFGLWAGLILGSRSIGADIGGGSGDFLLTRPRSRKYFIWVGWAVGAAEALVIPAITLLGTTVYLCFEWGVFWPYLRSDSKITFPYMGLVIALLLASAPVFTMVVYSGTYLVSILTRRRDVAVGVTVGLGIAYQVVRMHIRVGHSHLPDLLLTPWLELGPAHNQYRHAAMHSLMLWIICALLLPLVAQLVFERSEI